MYRKVIAYVEKLVNDGAKVSYARAAAVVKFGMADTTIRRLTKHLNVK